MNKHAKIKNADSTVLQRGLNVDSTKFRVDSRKNQSIKAGQLSVYKANSAKSNGEFR